MTEKFKTEYVDILAAGGALQLTDKLFIGRSGDGAGKSILGSNIYTNSTINASFNNLAIANINPASNEVVRRDYIDSLLDGLSWKEPADLATTTNITLSGEQVIDGILTSSSRVLVKDQTNQDENGVYTTGTPWIRTADANTGAEILKMATNIIGGVVNANKEFVNSNTSAINLGVTLITFINKSQAISHNNTVGLQGGTTNEYYHLNSSEHSFLTGQNQALKTTNSPTFNGLTLSSLTQNSIPFVGASGLISENNANLHWDNTNTTLYSTILCGCSPFPLTGDFTKYTRLDLRNRYQSPLQLKDSAMNFEIGRWKSYASNRPSTQVNILLTESVDSSVPTIPVLTLRGFDGDVSASRGSRVGVVTQTPLTNLHIGGEDGFLVNGVIGSGTTLDLGAGTRMHWYPKKGAFRAGTVQGTEWNDILTGNNSFAGGLDTVASGSGSAAFGNLGVALGDNSLALGNGCFSIGECSISSGLTSTSRGKYSISIGENCYAEAYSSAAFGRFPVVAGSLGVWVATDPLFILGNGVDGSNRSNAFQILKNGEIQTVLATGIVKSSSGILSGGNSVNLASEVTGTLPIGSVSVISGITALSTGGANNDKLATQGYVDDNGGGNPFDQSLNTTNSVVFNTLLLNGSGLITTSRLGSSKAIYTMQTAPAVGFNMYFEAGWFYGAGSSAEYGGVIAFVPSSGQFSISTTSSTGNAGGAATPSGIFTLSRTGIATLDLSSSKLGIGVSSINASAKLQVDSTSEGFLPPRMAGFQRNAIATPAQGLIAQNTTRRTLDVYTGARWAMTRAEKSVSKINSSVVTNTATETSVSGTLEGDAVIYGNTYGDPYIGATYKFNLSGQLQSDSGRILTLRIRFGGASGAIVYSQAITFTGGAGAGTNWRQEVIATFRTTASPANINTTGTFIYDDAGVSTTKLGRVSGTGSNFNAFIDSTIVFTAQWNIASATNSLTVENIVIDKIV